jgi:hypothetical protein
MKLIPWASALAALGCGILGLQGDPGQTVILSGDTQGYLSPCGCTSPMMGGIRRRATAIRALAMPGHTTLLENGGMVDAGGRQDAMKAETIVQSLVELGVTAINLGPGDARLGAGEFAALSQMSAGKTISLSLEHPREHSIGTTVVSGPFLVGGATDAPSALVGPLGDTAVQIETAARTLVDEAREAGLKPVLMLQGSRTRAVQLAQANPELALIQYSSVGAPPDSLEMVGATAIATTGEHGKHIVRLVFRSGHFENYKSFSLGPEYADDPVVSRYYSAYLRRVSYEKLLDKLPRAATPAFAGSSKCTSCHASSARIWKRSAHQGAYETLTKQNHNFDPDCVSCHVVGLNSTKGFRSMATTPHLAGVGCESCHGPALAHSIHPKQSKLPRITSRACEGCHNPQNSPNFQFDAYWRKIAHH